jgi:hypothetical protein
MSRLSTVPIETVTNNTIENTLPALLDERQVAALSGFSVGCLREPVTHSRPTLGVRTGVRPSSNRSRCR